VIYKFLGRIGRLYLLIDYGQNEDQELRHITVNQRAQVTVMRCILYGNGFQRSQPDDRLRWYHHELMVPYESM